MPEPLRVLARPASAVAGGNPYTLQLYENLRLLGVEVDEFTPGRLLRGSYDIAHFHWVDHFLLVLPRPVAYAKAAVFLVLTRLARRRGTKVVWTAHNTTSHESVWPARLESFFWRRFCRMVDGVIVLSRAGLAEVRAAHPGLRDVPAFAIPHGHYRDYYGAADRAQPAEPEPTRRGTRYLFFGQIRPYKNVPQLIRSFLESAVEDATLTVAGTAQPPLRDEVEGLAGSERVSLILERVADCEVAALVRGSDAVVLPYSRVLNSGAAMLALSFDRPVVLPRTETFAELQEVVGREWVFLYERPFATGVFQAAGRWLAERGDPDSVDLRPFEWTLIAERTLAAYRDILSGER